VVPLHVQFKECLKRATLSYLRTPTYNFTRLFFAVMVGLVLGLAFFRLGHSQKDIQPRLTILYIGVFFMTATTTNMAMAFFFQQRPVFYRERSSGMYAPFIYVLSLYISEIPYILVNTSIYFVIQYFLANLELSAEAFFYTWLMNVLFITFGVVNGMFFSVMLPNIALASVLVSSMNSLMSMFGGLTIARPEIPPYWIWVHWIDPFRYIFEGSVVSQFKNVPFYCKESELKDGVCPTTNGNQVLTAFGLHKNWFPLDACVVSAMILFLMALTLFFMGRKNHAQR